MSCPFYYLTAKGQKQYAAEVVTQSLRRLDFNLTYPDWLGNNGITNKLWRAATGRGFADSLGPDPATKRCGMSSNQAKLQGDILKLIHDRHFESGEKLFSERNLAERFSTTRAAVREAITALEALRVVERRRHSGIYLRDQNMDTSIDALVVEINAGIFPSLEQIEGAVELRRVLEVGAVGYAAMRHDADDIMQIRQAIDDSENRLLRGEPIAEEDERFHKAIVASTWNTMLVRVVNWFYEFSRKRRQRYFSDPHMSRISHEEHQSILAALEARDQEASADLMGEHLLRTRAIWAEIFESFERSGAAQG